MSRAAKTLVVEDLRERFERAPAVYLTDFTGLNVKSITKLRRELKAVGAEYVVIKNRLAKRSLAMTELPSIDEGLIGPTGVVFGYQDPVAAAKALSGFQKENQDRPGLKLGILDARVIDAGEVTAIAGLPPIEVIYSQVAGALEAPLGQAATVMAAKLKEMAGLVDALREERSSD